MLRVKVENFSNAEGRFVVARAINGRLWYWGTFDTRDKAEWVASQFENGIVVEKVENQEEAHLKEWKEANA